ncbi:hypothetical protein GCM10011519_27490 [Marmoricola endophyticus]|uniref:4-hydroxybenzoate polyprenyltransferase n=1 Tax=Marmoricola endophyticus TaxID=2040280 RepID=A0A917BPS6_9ACTN|nr:hypothetical protein GCM10011519_27490 [Marmoricola endophyticus]
MSATDADRPAERLDEAPAETATEEPPASAARSQRSTDRRARRELAVAMRQERRRVTPDDQRRARLAALGHHPGVLGGQAGVAAEPTTVGGSVREVLTQVAGIVRALHPRVAVVGGLIVGVLAYVSERPLREAVVAGAGVLVTSAVLGLVNDVRDQDRDHANGIRRKPVAAGRLPAGNASFVAACLTLLLVPLSLQNGVLAAAALAGILVSGLLSNLWFRRTWLSWLPWAVSFALVPAYLSYGGWGISVQGGPPTLSVTVLAALLGVAVHFLLALPDLVADRRSGFRHLPLRIALRTGATALLLVSIVFTGAVTLGLVAGTISAGLTR